MLGCNSQIQSLANISKSGVHHLWSNRGGNDFALFRSRARSRVWDEIDLRNTIMVLFVFFLVECVEMLREGLSNDRLCIWLAGLRTSTQLEWLIHRLVSGLKLKLLWLIVRNSQLRYT